MKAETTHLPGSKVELQITAEPEDINSVFQKAYQRLSQQSTVPGFRRGKAPAGLMKRHYGEDLIRQMAWRVFVEELYLPALEDNDLRPLFQPELPDLEEVEDFAEGQTMELKTVLTVHPRPRVPDYKSLKLLRPSTDVSDEEIDQQLQELREAYGERVDVDRTAVAEGDVVRAEVQICRADNEELIQETTSEFVADRDGDEPVARKLAGHMLAQTVTDETTVSGDHPNADLAGQRVIIKATIREIKERRLPELNDEFATRVDEELASLEALRNRIEEQLQQGKEDAAQRAVRNLAVAVVDTASDIDLPEELVKSVTASQMESYMQYLQQEGVSAEDSVRALQDDEDGVVSAAADQAMRGLKLHYIFQAIAETEGLEVSDEDVQEAISGYAQDNDLDEQMVKDAVALHEEVEDQVRNYAYRQKVIQILIDNAKIEEVPWEGYAVRARRYVEEYPDELRNTREDSGGPETDEPVTAGQEAAPAGPEPDQASPEMQSAHDKAEENSELC